MKDRITLKHAAFLRTLALAIVMTITLLGAVSLNPASRAHAATKTADQAIAWVQSQVGSGIDWDGSYGCQCVDLIMAYYNALGASPSSGNGKDYATNALPSGWTRVQGGTPQKGDILVYGASADNQYGHVAIYESDYATYHQNYNSHSYVEKITNVRYNGFTNPYWGYIRPNWTNNNEPQGYLDVATGGNGSIYVKGWAYDPDAKSASLMVHIYVGGPAGSGELHAVLADQLRTDVNDHFGITGNHGFETTIYTKKTGSQPIYFYALDTAGGNNPQFASATVNITGDTTGPTVSDIKVTNVTSTGYTVSCKVTDSGSGVNRVQFPTWTKANDQDDIVSNWTTNTAISGSKDGDTYTFRVKSSDHNNESGVYITDIYAWDNCGNESGQAGHELVTVPEPDTVSPVVTSMKVVSQNDTEVVIEADLWDNVGINTNRLGIDLTYLLADGHEVRSAISKDAATWVSDTKIRFTVGQAISEKQRVTIFIFDQDGNFGEESVEFELPSTKYITLKPGDTMSQSDFTTYAVVTDSGWKDRSWLGDILKNNGDGTFTALKEGKCTIMYYRTGYREYAGCTVIVQSPQHVHSYTSKVIEPTCTEQGYTLHECTCGDSYKDNYTDALDHDYSNCVAIDSTNHNGICVRCGKTVAGLHHFSAASVAKLATFDEDGEATMKCQECGYTKVETIPGIGEVALEKASFVYNAEEQKPEVIVKDSNGKTIRSDLYKVTYPSDCTSAGSHTAKVEFVTPYTGTKDLTFEILPKAITLSKVTAVKKGFTAKWKKGTDISGYELQYALNNKFTKSKKTAKITKPGTVSKKVTKLKAKKKYFVRIRAYKTVDGTKYYSAWSKVKSVKTKG